jgi:aerobic-type carbon monoxide dehydrogenase small subunit (CoxS/CutS family)
MLAVQAHGRAVTTIETPAPTRAMQVLKEEFHRAHALQCGFCTPGFLFAMEEFLSESAERSDEDIQEALNGNLCRRTGYINIFKAVRSAADRMNELAITVGDRD